MFDLDLSNNKLDRPGLIKLAKALSSNVGLMYLKLEGHRISSEVCQAFVEMYRTNVTLLKLIWKLDVAGYTLKFTEMTNRNCEIDRCVREGKDFTHLLTDELRSPLHARVPYVYS